MFALNSDLQLQFLTQKKKKMIRHVVGEKNILFYLTLPLLGESDTHILTHRHAAALL